MGEKYDSCYDEEPLYYGGPQIFSARVASPVGPGFPPDDLPQMLAGGPAGLQRIRDYSSRASSSMSSLASQLTQTLQQGAAGDANAKLAAGQQVVSQLQSGTADVRQQVAQGNVTLQMADASGAFQPGELEGVARDTARKLKHAASELDPVDDFIHTLLTLGEDRALSALGDQAEAAVGGLVQFASNSAARISNGLLRRQAGDVPGGSGQVA
jgi:hypothetical protein